MRIAAIWSVGVTGALVLGLGACHNRPAARHGHDRDRDGVRDRNSDRDHDRDSDEHGDEGPALGSGLSTSGAVRSITRARCERESRCDNVGPEKKFGSEGACEEKIRADWSGDLNKYECPNGIVQAELDECMKAIRDEDCGSPFDTLSRVTQCSASDICDGD